MSSPPDSDSGFKGAISSPGFKRLLTGQAVSSLGDWVATLAFIAAAFDLTNGNQTAVAVVLVLRLVPPIFAAPVGGVVADRLQRRTVMVTCDIARAAIIALVPFVNIGLLYVIAFIHESISLFFLPARDASIPGLVPEGSLEQANGLILASSYGSIPLAAALFGGLRLVSSHIPGAIPFGHLFREHPTSFAFFFDSATFVFSASMIAGLRIEQRLTGQRPEFLSDILEGFRYVVGHPALRSMAYGLVVSMFGGGVLFAVGIGYVRETLGGSDVAFGWLAALWGAGMGIGLAIVRLLVKERGAAPTFITAVALCGGVLLFMAFVPVLWLAFVAAVVFGAVFSVAIVLALTLAQETAEDRIRGRIMGGVQMLFRVGLGVGALGIGALAHSIHRVKVWITLDGNQVGLIAGGVLILLGAVASSSLAREGVWAGAPSEGSSSGERARDDDPRASPRSRTPSRPLDSASIEGPWGLGPGGVQGDGMGRARAKGDEMDRATTVAPITKSVTVSCSPERAFEIFTERFGEWWPIHTYSIGRAKTETAIFQGWNGGRVYEVIEGGEEALWGRVTVWDPPARIELDWQTNPEAPGPTHLTVTFAAEGPSGTRVDVDHRGWEIYGDRSSVARAEYETGWPGVLGLFAEAANAAA